MSNMVFVTPSRRYDWLDLQQSIITKLFPESESIVIDTNTSWPMKWFDWIDRVRASNKQYYTHLDEDCFLLNKQQIVQTAQMLHEHDLIGTSDGRVPYRCSTNNVAMNSFFMMGRVDSLGDHTPEHLRLLRFDQQTHATRAGVVYVGEHPNHEPYYGFFWDMLNRHKRFKYLDVWKHEHFASSNVRINNHSPDMCMHMWYSRNWRQHQDRYHAAVAHLRELHNL